MIYYFALPFIYLISILPFPLLYLFSDFVFVIVYYVLGYRKKVVKDNLSNAFPQKTEEEINKLCRKFYRYLCDLFLETFKTLTISKEEMFRRCSISQPALALFNKLNEEKRSCVIVMGHYGNWEWGGNAYSLVCKQQLFVIYHPLQNKKFNRLIINMRTRFGTKLIIMKDTFREMLSNKKIISATAFIADQTPPPESAYWTTFLNQETPVFRGTELVARKLNYPVVYVSVQKIKRGYYELFAEVLCENPQKTNEGEISEIHTRRLEKDIINRPEIWLWSHRRWKHKKH